MTSRDQGHEEEPVGDLLGARYAHTSPDSDAHSDAHPRVDDDLRAPHAIGRFVVLRRVGHGSMGEVYSAFDDELDRRVAIKLLRRQPRARESWRARMRREAQAMAKVSHPNVISVFEVGDHGDRTFIAMEYVEGQTLEHWQRGHQNGSRERARILDAYVQAGMGLAAAHRAGVLHRDFKPSNVLVDADGHVKVMDFGLAAWLRRSDSSASGQRFDVVAEDGEPQDSLVAARLTRAGTLLGTPAFMSPEQYGLEELDARSDQFSFCVALWEALVGMHPFEGKSVGELRTRILRGEVHESPGARALPSSLRRALLRGMARAPADRWPSMDALLGALRPGNRRTRWPLALAVASGLAVIGVSYGVTKSHTGLCEGAPERVARVWNDERRAAAREGLLRTGVPLAEATWSSTERALEAYTEQWTSTRQRVCEATRVRGEQSPELMDQRMMCLDLRLHALAGLLGTLENADLDAVLRAVDASARLPEVSVCETAGVGALADVEATRPEAMELQRRLVTARTQLELGRMGDARTELDSIRSEALARGLPRLAAEVLVVRGDAEADLGLVDQADATLETGLWEALAQGHDEAAFEASVAQLHLVGVILGDAERGRAGIERSESLLVRLGSPATSRLHWLRVAGATLGRHGELREAKARLDDALGLARQLHGTDHVEYGEVLNAAGMVAIWGGELDVAEQRFEELAELNSRLYQPTHTNVAAALNNLAIVAASRGDLDEAEGRFREVLELRSRVLGERHVEVGDAYMNVAGVAYQRNQPTEALPYIERARTIYAGSMEYGAKLDDADLVRGMVLTDLDRTAEAEALLRELLARQRAKLGERHPDLTRTLSALGRLLTRPSDAAEAVELLGTAVEIQREMLKGSDVPFEHDMTLAGFERELSDARAVLRGEAPAVGDLVP